MNRKKLFLVGGVFCTLVVGIAGYLLYTNLGNIIEAAIEKYGSEALKVAVRVDKVEIDPAKGLGVIHGLSVGNPKGFDTDHAFRLDAVKLDLNLETITDPVIVVREIAINRPAVTYEWAQTGSNIDQIQKNVGGGASSSKSGKSTASASSSSSSGPKLVINDLYIRDSQVAVSAKLPEVGQGLGKLGALSGNSKLAQLSKGKKIEKTLPTIHMKNLGKSEGGATPQAIAQKVIQRFQKQLGPMARNLGLKPGLGQARELAQRKINELKNQATAKAAAAASAQKDQAKSQLKKVIEKPKLGF